MIKKMRRLNLFWIFLALFVSCDTNGNRTLSNSNSWIVSVNEEKIGMDDYKRTYNHLVQNYKKAFGDAANEQFLESLNLKKQAVDQLIDRLILLQEARKQKIVVSNDEIRISISNMDMFLEQGNFDKSLYQKILTRNNMTAKEFEDDVREDLLIEKVTKVLLGVEFDSKVSAIERQKAFETILGELRAVSEIRFPSIKTDTTVERQVASIVKSDEDLFDAVMNYNTKRVKALLDKGADVNAKLKGKGTMLHGAALRLHGFGGASNSQQGGFECQG